MAATNILTGEGERRCLTYHLCETAHGKEWYVMEEGDQDGLGFDVSKRSLNALRGMDKC